MKIGILAYQGGIYEHKFMLEKAMEKQKINGEVVLVKRVHELRGIDGIVIPGGESTTIGKIAKRMGVLNALKEYIMKGLPAFGTCAGAIMLAKNVRDRVVGAIEQPILGVMDIEVVRNYYGRQRESFEIDLKVEKLGEKPFRGVFIRAPAIINCWDNTVPLAKLGDVIVAALQKHMLVTTFHPELTNDTRFHELFLNIVKR